jgi:alpha,alpha-trehalose phosphorylase
MIHRDVVALPAHIFPPEEWRVVELSFSQGLLHRAEAIFALSNGHLGMRGNVDESSPAHERGAYVNGFHETWPIHHPEQAFGFARTGQTIVALPDAKVIDLYVDEEPLYLPSAILTSYERALDMRAGVLDRELRWQTRSGKTVLVSSKRMVSFQHRHMAAISYEVTLIDQAAPVMIASRIVPPTPSAGAGEDPRAARTLGDRVLVPIEGSAAGERVLLSFRTTNSEMGLVCGMEHVIETDCAFTSECGYEENAGKVLYALDAEPGHTIRITKYIVYFGSEWATLGELRDRATISLSRGVRRGMSEMLAEQRAYMDDFWERSDVETGPDVSVQQAVRWNLFQLLQAAARADARGVPAKGLTGAAYEGHYFWDIEGYVVPFLVYTSPRLARHLLAFRHRMLDKARNRARDVNQAGALFPWRTISGEEASPVFEASTAAYHINADIMYALRQYVVMSGDRDFLFDEGAEMLVETARLWADIGFFSKTDNRFHIHGVTGPDEYTTLVNDNTFTNLMAQDNLRFAVETLRALHTADPSRYELLREKTGLLEFEVELWGQAAENMYVPYDQTLGINPQDAEFLRKKVWDFDRTPESHYPLLLHYHPLVIYRYQVIKQADVVMAMCLLPDEFPLEVKRRNFAYYDPLTTGDSSLSACVESVVASQIGERERALEYFNYGLFMDLGDLLANAAQGVHVAAAGGVWMALAYGFGGLTQRDGHLSFEPRLPIGWTRLAFRVQVQGSRLVIDITPEHVTYRLQAGDELTISHHGRPLTVTAGAATTVPAEPDLPQVDERRQPSRSNGSTSSPEQEVSGLP